MPRALGLVSLLFFAGASVVVSLAVGSVPIAFEDTLAALAGSLSGPAADIVWKLRLPRILAAFSCGGLLALAGVLLQVLLRNPLADPYIFGVSGGAALGVLLAMLLGTGTMIQTGSGLAGAIAASALVFGLSFRTGNWNPYRLLLTGVVVAAGLNAALSLILVLAPQTAVKGMLFWLMGDLSYATTPVEGFAVLVTGLLIAVASGRSLNLLAHGELVAATLGVTIQPLRRLIYVMASLFTAAAVTMGGSIGFIGLIVPHMLRLQGVRDHRVLLPAAALLGGCLLVIADTLARTLLAPRQLPVGTLTALIGVPVFLYLLYHSRERYGRDG